MDDRPPRNPGDRYVQALADLRAARQRYVDSKVPMDPVRRRPQVWMSEQEAPGWTPEQAAAVIAYAHA
jgi:hypothetical protein